MHNCVGATYEEHEDERYDTSRSGLSGAAGKRDQLCDDRLLDRLLDTRLHVWR